MVCGVLAPCLFVLMRVVQRFVFFVFFLCSVGNILKFTFHVLSDVNLPKEEGSDVMVVCRRIRNCFTIFGCVDECLVIGEKNLVGWSQLSALSKVAADRPTGNVILGVLGLCFVTNSALSESRPQEDVKCSSMGLGSHRKEGQSIGFLDPGSELYELVTNSDRLKNLIFIWLAGH